MARVGFVAARLFEPELPGPFGPLLDRLRRFTREADTEALRALHDELMVEGRALAAGTDPVPRSQILRAFSTGVLRATRLSATVEGGPARPATSLDRFIPDLQASDEPQLREALGPLLSPEDWLDVDARLAAGDRALRARRQVVAALHAHFPGQSADVVHRAFSALFVGHPLAVGEVSWIRTSTSTFFLVPYAQGKLTNPCLSLLDRQAAVNAFLGRLEHFEQRYFAHFPVFGGFRGEQAAPKLLSVLAERTECSTDNVAHHLTTSVSVLPRDLVDQYLVHDAWGHVWQALLFRFDESYQAAAGFEHIPDLSEVFAGQSLLNLAYDLARNQDLDKARAYLQDCLHHRLHVALSGLMAEVLADAIEGKITGAPLPTSSRLADQPTRLDLTLSDLPYYFRVATEGVRKLGEAPELLVGELKPFLPLAGAEAAASTLARAAEDLLSGLFTADFRAEPAGEKVRVNVFDRVALNFLGFQAAVNTRLPAAMAAGRGDVLLFALASYLEEDWAARFWHLDEMLEHLDELLEGLP